MGGQFVDLLRRHVLTRKIYVFIKRHDLPFLVARPIRRQATRAFGKARTLEMREHGTPGQKALPRGARPSVQLPAGSGGRPPYSHFRQEHKAREPVPRGRGLAVALDTRDSPVSRAFSGKSLPRT